MKRTPGFVSWLLLLSPWHEFLVHAWKVLGLWDDLVLMALLVGPLPRSRALLGVLFALVGVSVTSMLWHGLPWVHLRAMLPYVPAAVGGARVMLRERLLRWTVWMGVAASAYGLVSLAAFRLIGGGFGVRPPVENWLLKLLVYPYYCGIYPRGWRLVGAFLNDNYFGIWCGALICIAIVHPRLRWCLLILVPAWICTFSRSAVLGLVFSLLFLGWRYHTRALLLLLPMLGLAFLLASPRDVYRFTHPVATEGGRLQSISMGVEVLAGGQLLGRGPGTRGLADMQWAKIAYELGWGGVVVFVLIAGMVLRRSWRADPLQTGIGAAVLGMAVAGCGAEILEVPQTAILFWALVGMLHAEERQVEPVA